MSSDRTARASFAVRWARHGDGGIYLARADVARMLLDVAEAVVDLDEVSASVLAQLVDDLEAIGPP